jgi:ribonuclease Y
VDILLIVLPLAAIVIGTFIGYIYRRNVAEAKVGRAEDSVKKLLSEAQKKVKR